MVWRIRKAKSLESGVIVVVLALGALIQANRASFAWGQDKASLQQNVSEALDWMTRSIRAARTLQVNGTEEFRTFDEAGNLEHVYERATDSGVPRLLVDGSPLIQRRCHSFLVTANSDTTSVTLKVVFESDAGDFVAQIHSPSERPTRLDLPNCAILKTDQAN